MVIGIDLDDTLNMLSEEWLARYNRRLYGDCIRVEDIKTWDIGAYCKNPTALMGILVEPGLFNILKLKPGAKEAIKYLRDRHDVYIVIAYLASTCKDKADWIRENLSIETNNIIFCNNKHLIRLDMLIDDGPHNFSRNAEHRIAFAMPWNSEHQWEDSSRPHFRSDSWESIIEHIRMVKNG
jgi:5'-nucleotidase